MTRSAFSSVYTPVSGSATALTFSSTDDGTTMIPLPFDFNYLGTTFVNTSNYLAVCTNGWASFSTSSIAPSTTQVNTNLYAVSSPLNTLAPWWDDLNVGVVGTNPAGGASWEVTGSAPNRVMTVQWVASSFYTTTGGQPRQINFQVKLYETTNVIEFWYGAATGAVTNTSESASIGLSDATGGNGHYLDGVTGSCYTGNADMQSDRFPTYNLRFTPGAPTPLAAGTYNVGVGQTYINLNEAAADVNQRGVSGPVVFNLVDAQYDATAANGGNFFPILIGPISGTSAVNTVTFTKSSTAAVIRYGGASGTSGSIVNQASTTALASNVDPIIGLVGADYVTLNNLDIRGNVGNQLADHGLGVYNSSATDGAQHNTFTNISVTMNRANTGSVGIRQSSVTTATASTGANSNNIYKGLTIKNCFVGITLSGTSGFPDDACEIGTNACGTFNVIGDPLTANDIGNNGGSVWGIKTTNESNVKIYNNVVVNVTGTNANPVDAIFVDNAGVSATVSAGTCMVYNNNITAITSTSTGTSVVRGIRCNLNANAGSVSEIYNNTVSGLNSASTFTSSRRVIGISVQDAGGGAGATHNVDFNSVRIAPAVANCNNTCFEIGTASGPVMNVRNNIFANFTGAQATVKHYCWVSTSATSNGNAGSVSNYNDLYVNNTTNGFTALGNTTDYATLANWQAITSTPDLNSIAVDPQFSSAIDLHTSAAALDNAGNNTGIPWVTVDIDCQARPQPAATNFDIGADEITGCSGMPSAGTAGGNPASVCGSGTFTIQTAGASTGIGITYQWQESATPGGPYTNCTTGSGINTSTYTTASISSTMYYVCLVTCSNSGLSATTNEVVATVNASPTVTITPNPLTICAGGAGASLTASGANTYTWAPSTGLSATTGSTVTANPASSITYTITGTAANGCTSASTVPVTVNEVPSLTSPTATPATVCSGANSQLLANGGLTNAYTISNITYAPVSTPGSGVTTLANNGTAVTALNAGTLDDGDWVNQVIPFNFTYFGTIYTSFALSTNGFICLGSGAPNTYTSYNNAMPSVAMGRPAIGPVYADLDFRTAGTINYFTSGSA
ncbi:MAG TPA: hypothetical protein VFU15_16855, partial [Bacteroidia bacterium]|nr:hypothetical protein [Bacteroidia bacterium]